MRARLVLLCTLLAAPGLLLTSVQAASTPNPDFKASGGVAPERATLEVDSPEVRDALKYVMTEMKRLSNQYRYVKLRSCHKAEAGKANFDGRNLFLDIEFDLLNGQPSRHDVIVFKDEHGVVTGMALDEFPEVRFRQRLDPDVN